MTSSEVSEDSERYLKFGKLANSTSHGVLLAIAKGSYVLGRISLNSSQMLLYPVGFFLMHHSIESFIKAFLRKENILFKLSHDLIYLLNVGVAHSRLSFFQAILQRRDYALHLKELSDFYASNKYGETAFSMEGELRGLFDEIVFTFAEELKKLYPNESEQNYTFDVPEEMVSLFEKNLPHQLRIAVWPKD